MEKTVRMSLLFDFYGPLLTERQREFFTLYYDDDLSLGEIADQFGVSRQAVYDILKRSVHALEEFESKLQLVERFQEQQRALEEIEKRLHEAETAGRVDPERAARSIQEVRERLKSLL